MATTTVLDLIRLSMKKARVLGTGDILSDEDAQDALDEFNLMLESWSLDKLFVYVEALQTFTLTGAVSYTIGTGGDFSTTRPTKLVSAYTQINSVSYPIEILDNAEQYDNLRIKSLGSAYPTAVYYERTYPLGILHFWPLSSGTVNLRFTQQLQQFPTLTTPISLPIGYKDAIVNQGAIRLAAANGLDATPAVVEAARSSVARLKRFNSERPTMRVEAALMGRGRSFGSDGGWVNGILTDSTGNNIVV